MTNHEQAERYLLKQKVGKEILETIPKLKYRRKVVIYIIRK